MPDSEVAPESAFNRYGVQTVRATTPAIAAITTSRISGFSAAFHVFLAFAAITAATTAIKVTEKAAKARYNV